MRRAFYQADEDIFPSRLKGDTLILRYFGAWFTGINSARCLFAVAKLLLIFGDCLCRRCVSFRAQLRLRDLRDS